MVVRDLYHYKGYKEGLNAAFDSHNAAAPSLAV